MLAARIPGLQLERPEAPIDPAATPTTTAPTAPAPTIILTEEDIPLYGG